MEYKKNILFIADGYPTGNNAGALLYVKLIKLYGVSFISYFGASKSTNSQWPEVIASVKRKRISLRIFSPNRYYSILGRIPLIEEIFYFLFLPYARYKLLRFIKENKIDIILCVLRGDANSLINYAVEKTKLPLITYISDTIEAEFSDKLIIFNYKVKEHYRAIKNSMGVYVASESMDKFVVNDFHKPTTILRLGYPDNIKSKKNITKEICVFFCGSVYAEKEFESFLSALDGLALKYPNFKVKFIVASGYKIKTFAQYVKVIQLGWIKENELYPYMWESHFGYIPYRFDLKYKTQSQYAFPSKTGFYLSSGLPVFFHGPTYSSMSDFFHHYSCGIHCASTEVNVVHEYLEYILFNESVYNQYLQVVPIAFKNEFSEEVMKQNFLKLLESNNG